MGGHYYTRRLTVHDAAIIRKILLVYIEEEVTAKAVNLTPFEKEVYVKAHVKVNISYLCSGNKVSNIYIKKRPYTRW